MSICYLGVGSNLKSPERQLRQAFEHIRKMPKTVILRISPLYFNDALGRRGQPPYCNCVIKISTSLPPLQLLKQCQLIEKKHHRVRKVRWGARTLDIDILRFGNLTLAHRHLIIPHPRMHERDFVMIPLSQISFDINQ